MFEKIGNMLNGKKENSSDDVVEQTKKVEELKKEAEKPENAGEIETKVEFKKGGQVDVNKNFTPSDMEMRYREAKKKLDEMKSESQDEAIELDDRYNKLIADRNDIIDKIQEADEESLEELRSELGRKNKEIRTFEEEQLNL